VSKCSLCFGDTGSWSEEGDMFQASCTIGGLELKNCFVMAPVKTGYGNLRGEVSEQHITYYRRRAEGGCGMIICEPFFIHSSGKELPTQIGIHQDSLLDGLKALVKGVHSGGSRICAHLNHAGRAANPKLVKDRLMAPSAIACPTHGRMPHEMSEDDIKEILFGFSEAAQRAVQAGFDAIELQFGLGYLAHQFFSPHTNHRADQWKEPLAFCEHLVRAVRLRIGPDFPLIARISGQEFVKGGTTLKDSQLLVRMLEHCGINAFHIVNGSACDSPPVYYQFFTLPQGQNVATAEVLRRTTHLPLIVSGRNGDPANLRELDQNSAVDFIGMGRPLVADPDLPKKMLDGQDNAVYRCGYCLQGCLAGVKALKGLRCVVNPQVGQVGEQKIAQTPVTKKVLVVGGGPAGIKAALTAESRGHNVDLYEKSDHLGGQFALSFLAPAKSGMEILHRDLLSHLKSSSIRVHLGVEVDLDLIKLEEPDTLILSTGARPRIVPIMGFEEVPYHNGFNIYGFKHWKRVRNAVVIGGGLIGVEAAEFIAEKGIPTAIFEILPDVAADMEMISRKLLFKRINALPVKIYTDTQVTCLEKKTVHFRKEETEGMIANVDLLVFATGTVSENQLERPAREAGFHVLTAGDMVQPGKIFEAIHSGFEAGMKA
jgi:2,4-dienoyl-CoA reductase-like NADH-dependent reductase (Old Yellow Enzyme family)/thioredoxin reductase